MKIELNGEPFEIVQSMTVKDLLLQSGFEDSFVAVAINQTCINRKLYAETLLKENDQVEILAPMAGG